jgi:hypothetical protein
MQTKDSTQRFVFEDLSYRDYPNQTDKVCAVVSKDLDLTNKKLVGSELVDKDEDDFAAELAAKALVLDTKYKTQREAALMSFDLTIFTDTTISGDQQADILRVRQEWMDMTSQSNYPFDFITPALDPVLW